MTFKELLENSPLGSFEDLRRKVSDEIDTLINKTPFVIDFVNGEPIQRRPWITYMFPDKVVVEWVDTFFEITYKIGKKGNIKLGTPKKVEMIFKVKESADKTFNNSDGTHSHAENIASDLKEAGIVPSSRSKQELDMDLTGFLSLKEATYDSDTGVLEVVLIEQGTNMGKKRHYPASTIQEAAPLFSGLKMYIDHPTAAEEKAKPERSIKDWASTIVESHYDAGKAIGKIAVHDSWLRERLSDPVFREHIGLSINAGGQISYGKIDGQEVQIIEKIVMHRRNGPASVDWVTEAGARGRVSRLLKESKTGGKTMDLQEATLDDIQKENPKLLESITNHVKTSIKESEENQTKDKELKESKAELVEFKRKDKETKQANLVESILKENKALIPLVKTRVAAQVNLKLYESETELKEALAEKIKEELAYANQLSPKGRIITNSADNNSESLTESLGNELDKRAGVAEKKDDDK